jgi:hypothetical protein
MSWPGIRVTLGASSERWVRRPTSSTVLAIIRSMGWRMVVRE